MRVETLPSISAASLSDTQPSMPNSKPHLSFAGLFRAFVTTWHPLSNAVHGPDNKPYFQRGNIGLADAIRHQNQPVRWQSLSGLSAVRHASVGKLWENLLAPHWNGGVFGRGAYRGATRSPPCPLLSKQRHMGWRSTSGPETRKPRVFAGFMCVMRTQRRSWTP